MLPSLSGYSSICSLLLPVGFRFLKSRSELWREFSPSLNSCYNMFLTCQRYLVHLVLQIAVGDIQPHRGAVLAVPLPVLGYGHRARVSHVEMRPPGLMGFICRLQVQQTNISEKMSQQKKNAKHTASSMSHMKHLHKIKLLQKKRH